MSDQQILKSKLQGIADRDYGAYQSLKGEYEYAEGFKLIIHQIPKDPYAPPHTGIYRIIFQREGAKYINYACETKIQEIAFRDFLARRFYSASKEIAKEQRGTGFSGTITVNKPGQAILERNCVVIDDKAIEIRCFLGLPANGRKINAKVAIDMLNHELPEIVEKAFLKEKIDHNQLQLHLNVAEDADILRKALPSKGLIAFVADGSVLPRRSGTSDLPLEPDSAIPFKAPESLKVEFDLPHAGRIEGMGIPTGVNLIVGGGYHGKSTLLEAVELGCYNHTPGDGRERCVSLTTSVKIRAYSGRYIENTDISPFICNLPFKKDTKHFSTENASGSTSQAASIIEAIESGAEVLLMDEDTSATNFMIRDAKMQQLVKKDDEPITTFIDKVNPLCKDEQISTILVLGGVGDYFNVSDHVIQMINYQPADVTREAHAIAGKSPEKRIPESGIASFQVKPRLPVAESINPHNHYGKRSIYAKEVRRINFGKVVIDLTDLEQLRELSQTKALAEALLYAKKYMDQKATLKEIIDRVVEDVDQNGLDILSDRLNGHFAEFRPFELAFAMNRLRGFRTK